MTIGAGWVDGAWIDAGWVDGAWVEAIGVDEFFFGPDDTLQDDDAIIMAVIKDFIKRVT